PGHAYHREHGVGAVARTPRRPQGAGADGRGGRDRRRAEGDRPALPDGGRGGAREAPRREGRARGGGARVTTTAVPAARAGGAALVLLTLAAGQFLMTLDSSVMNVSIATVAKDVGTTVTGIQGAITAYTLVMAALMITGPKVGAISG